MLFTCDRCEETFELATPSKMVPRSMVVCECGYHWEFLHTEHGMDVNRSVPGKSFEKMVEVYP